MGPAPSAPRSSSLRGGRLFYYARIGVLSSALLITLLWAWHDRKTRLDRTTWQRPLHVALVLVRLGKVDDSAVKTLFLRSHTLQQRLAEEFRRYRDDLPRPIEIVDYGPVDTTSPPPNNPGTTFTELARHTWDMWRWTRAIDDAGDVPTRGFDSRIYLVARPPANSERRWVEGLSEEGGRVGMAQVELDNSSVDFGLFVVAHELFHTLGASDKYDMTGRALVPDGLPEPDRKPLYPQRFAEVMARNRVLSPTEEEPPDSLDELGVGPATAREIHWAKGL